MTAKRKAPELTATDGDGVGDGDAQAIAGALRACRERADGIVAEYGAEHLARRYCVAPGAQLHMMLAFGLCRDVTGDHVVNPTTDLGLAYRPILGDGSCFFRAIATVAFFDAHGIDLGDGQPITDRTAVDALGYAGIVLTRWLRFYLWGLVAQGAAFAKITQGIAPREHFRRVMLRCRNLLREFPTRDAWARQPAAQRTTVDPPFTPARNHAKKCPGPPPKCAARVTELTGEARERFESDLRLYSHHVEGDVLAHVLSEEILSKPVVTLLERPGHPCAMRLPGGRPDGPALFIAHVQCGHAGHYNALLPVPVPVPVPE